MKRFDQAHDLRDAVIKKDQIVYNTDENHKDIETSGPRVICVSSGKGGVGKSNFTINTALALQSMGKRVLVIDADIGLANVEILLGIMPQYSLLDVVKHDLNIEKVITKGPNNLGIISGGSCLQTITDLSAFEINKLIKGIATLKDFSDYIFIDTGAGISSSVTSFIAASDELILVTTPEPPAIADAYALIKLLSQDAGKKKISVVINRSMDEKEGKTVFSNLNFVAKRFLDMELNYLGYVFDDENVSKSVRSQKPFYINCPKTKAKTNIDNITAKLLNMKMEEKGFKNFINKLKKIF